MPSSSFTRRAMLRAVAGFSGSALLPTIVPAWAGSGSHGLVTAGGDSLSGEAIALAIGRSDVMLGRRRGHAVTVNGSLPGPLIRLREGQNVRLSVTNTLTEDSSVHWHGLLVPFQFDGVPGVSFPGIRPGETFTYDFPVKQAGTYWYHSHSNMQEAMGLYGAIVIDPAAGDQVQADREHILVLSDWSFTHPHMLLRRLKQMGGYYNRQRQTVAGLLAGRDQPIGERLDWAAMRMDPTDISDVTGSTYSYLINGHDSVGNWTGLFTPGERVRLRIVNASAMTNFNIRLPGLAMTVVQADGQDVIPVETDELQIAIAETYDVVVQPPEARAYGFIAEAIDRSGQCRATLAPAMGLAASIPPIRKRPLLTMRDMGMTHGATAMPAMDHGAMDHAAMGHAAPPTSTAPEGHGAMKMRDATSAPAVPLGPGVASLSPMPTDRTGDRPTGLDDVAHRVLTYRDLRAALPNPDTRPPGRSITLHLTANMERYMWSFDGVKYSDGADPIALHLGERVRITLVNDTMMPHPIHLHGHFFELLTGADDDSAKPRKHTVNVLPGGKLSFDLTADAPGDWAFHCHMLLHMHAGMFRVVTVREGRT
ncbi:copper resistance system multicopper oxidase [Sphingobium sp. AN558]|uniref:copper resistance system multicopper oxidase n=1 Tax=Sphingobium sp. AN558 TaxID=3133442 RepID=UPI0030C04C98